MTGIDGNNGVYNNIGLNINKPSSTEPSNGTPKIENLPANIETKTQMSNGTAVEKNQLQNGEAEDSQTFQKVKSTTHAQAVTQIDTVNSDTPKIGGPELGEQILNFQTEYHFGSTVHDQREIDVLESKFFRESISQIKTESLDGETYPADLQSFLENNSSAFHNIGNNPNMKRAVMDNLLLTPQSVLKKICDGGKIDQFVENTINAFNAKTQKNKSRPRMETWAPLLGSGKRKNFYNDKSQLQIKFAASIKNVWGTSKTEQAKLDRDLFQMAGKETPTTMGPDHKGFNQDGLNELENLLSQNSKTFRELGSKRKEMIEANIANLPGVIRDLVCENPTTLENFVAKLNKLTRDNGESLEDRSGGGDGSENVGVTYRLETWRFAIDPDSGNSAETTTEPNDINNSNSLPPNSTQTVNTDTQTVETQTDDNLTQENIDNNTTTDPTPSQDDETNVKGKSDIETNTDIKIQSNDGGDNGEKVVTKDREVDDTPTPPPGTTNSSSTTEKRITNTSQNGTTTIIKEKETIIEKSDTSELKEEISNLKQKMSELEARPEGSQAAPTIINKNRFYFGNSKEVSISKNGKIKVSGKPGRTGKTKKKPKTDTENTTNSISQTETPPDTGKTEKVPNFDGAEITIKQVKAQEISNATTLLQSALKGTKFENRTIEDLQQQYCLNASGKDAARVQKFIAAAVLSMGKNISEMNADQLETTLQFFAIIGTDPRSERNAEIIQVNSHPNETSSFDSGKLYTELFSPLQQSGLLGNDQNGEIQNKLKHFSALLNLALPSTDDDQHAQLAARNAFIENVQKKLNTLQKFGNGKLDGELLNEILRDALQNALKQSNILISERMKVTIDAVIRNFGFNPAQADIFSPNSTMDKALSDIEQLRDPKLSDLRFTQNRQTHIKSRIETIIQDYQNLTPGQRITVRKQLHDLASPKAIGIDANNKKMINDFLEKPLMNSIKSTQGNGNQPISHPTINQNGGNPNTNGKVTLNVANLGS